MKRMNPGSTRDRIHPGDRPARAEEPGPGRLGASTGWDRFTADVEPLPADKPPVDPGTLARGAATVREGNAGAKAARRQLEIGRFDGLNRRQADQLRRGDYPVQGRLDLHGSTADEARTEIARFLQSAAARELRCVLVITGQGRDDFGRPRGVLRDSLEKWLNAPRTRRLVLACAPAQRKDGGHGAFYILLRRKRQPARR